jgi:hypothetical protein
MQTANNVRKTKLLRQSLVMENSTVMFLEIHRQRLDRSQRIFDPEVHLRPQRSTFALGCRANRARAIR